jgi:hypothetical protein
VKPCSPAAAPCTEEFSRDALVEAIGPLKGSLSETLTQHTVRIERALRKHLGAFRSAPAFVGTELRMPAQESGERKLTHNAAEELGLGHSTVSEGNLRIVVVTRELPSAPVGAITSSSSGLDNSGCSSSDSDSDSDDSPVKAGGWR